MKIFDIVLFIFALIGLVNAYAAFMLWLKKFIELLERKVKSIFWFWFIIIVVSFGWIALFEIIKRLFASGWGVGIPETLSNMGIGLVSALTVVLTIGTLIMIDRMLKYGDEPDGSGALVRGGAFVYFAWAILACWLLLLSSGTLSTFIYFQF